MGPLAAMFGREFQQYLLEHKGVDKISKAKMQYSVDSGRTSMNEKRIQEVHHEYVDDGRDDDRASQASKRTRSPRRDSYHKAPWNQSPTNRCDVDIRGQYGDRRLRDVRQLPDYDRLRENLHGPRGGDRRDQDFYPREDEPRGSISDRRNYTQSEPEPREPRHYERKSKDRQSRPYDRESDRRTARRD